MKDSESLKFSDSVPSLLRDLLGLDPDEKNSGILDLRIGEAVILLDFESIAFDLLLL